MSTETISEEREMNGHEAVKWIRRMVGEHKDEFCSLELHWTDRGLHHVFIHDVDAREYDNGFQSFDTLDEAIADLRSTIG